MAFSLLYMLSNSPNRVFGEAIGAVEEESDGLDSDLVGEEPGEFIALFDSVSDVEFSASRFWCISSFFLSFWRETLGSLM